MSTTVPVRELQGFYLRPPEDDRWLDDRLWLPLGLSELHLVCRFFPLVVDFAGSRPQLGIVINQSLLRHPPLGPDGRWTGIYRPIAMRSFPFELGAATGVPLDDVAIDRHSPYLSDEAGIALTTAAGAPAPLVAEAHRLLGLLRQSEHILAGLIDQFLIADLLVPLAPQASSRGASDLRVIDGERLRSLSHQALAALVRHNYRGLDVAMASLHSLQNLRPDLLPGRTETKTESHAVQTALVPGLHDELPLALDDGELIPLGLFSAGLQPLATLTP